MNLRPRINRAQTAYITDSTHARASGRSGTTTNKPSKRPRNGYKPPTRQLASAYAPVYDARFPVEVWWMIVSYLSSVARGVHREVTLYLTIELSHKWRERSDTLRALSQTCRALRDTMLPLLWENVETCSRASEDDDLDMNKLAAYTLRQYSLGLLRTPVIAGHVKVLTVSLLRGSSHPFLKQFTKCLTKLPNLRNLRIVDCDLSAEVLDSAFQRKCYNQITDLILPATAYPMLQAFPQILKLFVIRPRIFLSWLSGSRYGSRVYEAIIINCHHLKALQTDIFADYPTTTAFDAVFPQYMQRLAEAVPSLETIMISIYIAEHTPLELFFPVSDPVVQVGHLAQFPNLAHIKLNVLPAIGLTTNSASFKEKAQACFESLQKIVDGKSHGKPRSVLVRTWPLPSYYQSPHQLVDLAFYHSESAGP